MLVRDEPYASIIQEALQSLASGRFTTQSEVKRFLESQPDYPHDRKGEVHFERVAELVSRPLYAGYVEAPNWGVSLRPGRHEGLITFAEYQKIQERLKSQANAPGRKDLDRDFPLRGAVLCADCGNSLTAGWSKGRKVSYPYYLCYRKGCAGYGRSIKRGVIEGEFAALLKSLQPTPELFRAGRKMFEKIWNHRLATGETRRRSLKDELGTIEKQVEQFLDRIADADAPAIITAYENRIRKLEEERIVLKEKIAACGRPLRSFDQTLRTAFDFLENPVKLWVSDRIEDKRTVLKLVFADRLTYVRNEGFRTANLALPFKALVDFSEGGKEMVPRRGLEPPRPQGH